MVKAYAPQENLQYSLLLFSSWGERLDTFFYCNGVASHTWARGAAAAFGCQDFLLITQTSFEIHSSLRSSFKTIIRTKDEMRVLELSSLLLLIC